MNDLTREANFPMDSCAETKTGCEVGHDVIAGGKRNRFLRDTDSYLHIVCGLAYYMWFTSMTVCLTYTLTFKGLCVKISKKRIKYAGAYFHKVKQKLLASLITYQPMMAIVQSNKCN